MSVNNKCVKEPQVWIITPFERPDAEFAKAAAKAGAFPFLHLGRSRAAAEEALNELAGLKEEFGVCIADKAACEIELPSKVKKIILPCGMKAPEIAGAEIAWQACSEEDAQEALALGAKTLILKGAEGAGLCSEDSSFILFQKLIAACASAGAEVFIQGGVGLHTAAAYMALGAAGVILDSQIAMFPEYRISPARKTILSKLSGNEIRNCSGFNYYAFPGSKAGDISELGELIELFGSDEGGIVPLGQDIILASDLADQHKRLRHLVRALKKAPLGHLRQARIRDVLAPGGETAKGLGSLYPLVQGPMARISDTPEFLRGVADAGALPFLAMGLMTGERASEALAGTAAAMGDKPWGAGILGFAHPKTVLEQTKLILESKPSFVLIAGSRPGQAKVFESAGIQALLHAATPGQLDMLLKDGSRAFIFEGRESGGHVGPLFSAVLWEKQINSIFNLDSFIGIRIFFAGGIHDELSAAFVRIMAGSIAAHGVQIGLLCGTAYLYTEEAVECGAIEKAYQRLIIEKNRTVLLKSAVGQETRCVPSPFTEHFLSEKEKMEKEGLESLEILQRLEEMNLGRLRIASKGYERIDGALVTLPENEQLEKGLYMTGAVAELADKTTTLSHLHETLLSGSLNLLSKIDLPEMQFAQPSPADIAVIGMDGIFPQAADADEFWRNIIFGYDCITEVPKDRWSAELFYDPDAKDTDHAISKWGGFLGKTDFNALEFGITPQSLASIEPVQLLSLLVTKRAFENAGFTELTRMDLDDTAVIFGSQGGGELAGAYASRAGLMQLFGMFPEEADETLPRLTEDSLPGVTGNITAGRISNRLNTGGRNFTVDAACASSLAALDIAITELNSGKANMVILGGADLHNSINEFLLFSSTYALSRKGRCATFDSDADGIALGEGVGVVILKRLKDAQEDGNKIYAVIKGSGGSSDGKSFGMTAPSLRGQIRALEQAYENTGIKPSEVGMIEPHGTGTVIGDKIELRALTDVYLEDGAAPGQTAISSLKSLIGHTKCAAGIAALIKAVNCVRHGVFPPTLHLNKPNAIYMDGSPFAFRTEKAGYWHAERRIAGMSGFGFGGTNFHALIENYDPGRPETLLKSWPAEIFAFPGETPEDAKRLMGNVEEMFVFNDKLRLRDVAYSLASRCGGGSVQYVIVAGSREELIDRMNSAREDISDERVYPLSPIEGKVAFLFPGQGSQRVNMAADLFVVFPRMRKLLNELPEYEQILFPTAVFTDEQRKAQRKAITDTRSAQVLLGVVDLAIAGLLKHFGVSCDMVAGHSYGELPALCFAGAFDEESLPGLSRARAEAILSAAADEPGRMAAVFSDRETLESLLDGEKDVWAVNFNSPRQTVVAGTDAGIEAFLNKAEEAEVSYTELNVACAFHSPIIAGADENFAAALKEVGFSAPELPVWSNTSAGIYPEDGIQGRLAEHLVKPVLFAEEIQKMYDDGACVFIEAGPGEALTKLASEILKDKSTAVIQTERNGTEGLTFFLEGLAKYIATGRMIDMEKLFEGRDAVMLNTDEPSLNKKNGIIWNVDGRYAVPEVGELPPHAWKSSSKTISPSVLKGGASELLSVEHVMMAYLDNMNNMIQDQRDVMIGYLGAPELAPRAGVATRRLDLLSSSDNLSYESKGVQGEEAPADEESELPDLLSLSAEQITDMIFAVVSEKTGYPVEMLDLDMDMEADLSIDSIKKMDIVAELLKRVKFQQSDVNMDLFFEKIVSIKKFRELTAWIEKIGQDAAEGKLTDQSSFEGAQFVPKLGDEAAPPIATPTGIIRMTYFEKDRPIKKKDLTRISGKTFAVTNDGNGLAEMVAQSLWSLGAKPEIFQDPKDDRLSECDGVILINSSCGANKYTAFDLFDMLKSVNIDRLQWALAFDDAVGAALSSKNISGLPEGFSGFLKTMAHEYLGKSFRTVLFETVFDPEAFAEIVVDELATDDFIPEICYRNRDRILMVPEIREGKAEEDINVLDGDSTVVVLGGAQGITAHIAARFAKDVPCRYILIGRTPYESKDYPAFEAIDEVRRYLIEQEGMKQPREIEARAKVVLKSTRITASIARIEEAGAKAEYMQADAMDSEAFAAALSEIKSRYGKIDGVIHAAGILEDKFFSDKDRDSFERVYNTKAQPLMSVVKELLPELKMLVLFSSTSAAFGNAGQVDYAAGNSAMDITAEILKKLYPALKVTAFSWGPWKGAGMVTSALEKEFLKKGISFIELSQGADFFANELKYNDDVKVIAIESDEKSVTEFIKMAVNENE
jgi:acyl transferase domain-containing protein/NAD(P)H-dependent flavin oxidoreductase YrpB (nitropropane dioxygenase family)/NAD(P)-dependent dehydrogenase (short-subunit alcohol dehydrogenase family)